MTKKTTKDLPIYRLIPMPSNDHQLIIMDTENRATIWDIKTKRLLRHLPTFNGVVSKDGKFGIYSPSRGGLHIIDMKNGQIVKTFIGQVAEGVNDVKAQFTKTGEHVLYYHSGQQTLRAHRMSDGLLVGTFRPHSRITTWTSDESGQMIVIGGQDGSLLTSFLYDLKIYPDSQRNLAQLPSRRYLAEHLNIPIDEADTSNNSDFRNLTVLTKAVQKFKNLANKDAQASQVCSIQ